jgi:hypothetical protein
VARLAELIEDDKGKLDEQALLAIIIGLTFVGLEIWTVVVMRQPFHPGDFGDAAALYVVGSPGGLGLRKLLERGRNAGNPDQSS